MANQIQLDKDTVHYLPVSQETERPTRSFKQLSCQWQVGPAHHGRTEGAQQPPRTAAAGPLGQRAARHGSSRAAPCHRRRGGEKVDTCD